VGNALQAVEILAEKNPNADFALVLDSLAQLAAAEPDALRMLALPTRIISDARRLRERLQATGLEGVRDK
jgi:hypothetical protein